MRREEGRKATARVPTLPNILPRLYYGYGRIYIY